MAKAYGGLFSLEARGSIGKVLTYMTWRGQQRVRKWTIPQNPNTADQITVRQQFTDAVDNWQSLDAEQKTPWDEAAELHGNHMSGFNFHVGKYIEYIRAEENDPPDDAEEY